jgi:hypothetical protein
MTDDKQCVHGWRVKTTPTIIDVTEAGVVYQHVCPECGRTWTELRDERLAQIALFVARKERGE